MKKALVIFMLLIGFGCLALSGYLFQDKFQQEAGEKQMLAGIVERQQTDLLQANDQLNDTRFQLGWAREYIDVLENNTNYRYLYEQLDNHYKEYLSQTPSVTIDRENLRITPEGVIFCGDGQYRITRVADTGSMRPVLGHDYLALLEKVDDIDDVQIGDIAVYEVDEYTSIIHRIVGEDGDCWIFRGDANLTDDAPVYKEKVTWRVVAVFY